MIQSNYIDILRTKPGGENLHNLIPDIYYRFAFENSLDAILLTRPSGSIVRANSAACLMFNRTEEEICQLGRYGIVDIDDPRLNDAIKERNEKGEVRVELNFVRKDGTIFPVYVTSKIFYDDKNEVWSVMIIKDISHEKHSQIIIDKLHENTLYLANHDYLTDALNRRGFMDVFQVELTRCERDNTSCGIALIDIDYFKEVNDRFGHIFGDTILQRMVNILKECLRPYDVIGRFGGDEFILCLPNLNEDTARLIGERLRSRIEQETFYYETQPVQITISIGLKVIRPETIRNIDINKFVSDVDQLMYQAKRHRNSVYVSE
jgi:diguanylate cyclase (GGDEF)-like protein/PAS domain S-box-containing protein